MLQRRVALRGQGPWEPCYRDLCDLCDLCDLVYIVKGRSFKDLKPYLTIEVIEDAVISLISKCVVFIILVQPLFV